MNKIISYLLLFLLAVPSAFAGEDGRVKDWGHLTGSLESNNHFYMEDAANVCLVGIRAFASIMRELRICILFIYPYICT